MTSPFKTFNAANSVVVPVPFVIVRHCFCSSSLERERWLRPVERLDLALLVHAEDQGILWWIEVQADDVFELLDEVLVITQLECLHKMGLETVCLPETLHNHVTDAVPLSHSARTPVCGIPGFGLESVIDDVLQLLAGNDWFAPSAFADLFSAHRCRLFKSIPPKQDSRTAHGKLRCNATVRDSLGCKENNGGTKSNALRCRRSANQGV